MKRKEKKRKNKETTIENVYILFGDKMTTNKQTKTKQPIYCFVSLLMQ